MTTTALALSAPMAWAQPLASAEGVVLTKPATARSAPSYNARAVARVQTYTPLTLRNAIFPVVSQDVTSAGAGWVRVRLPRRPNGATGWIPARVTRHVGLEWRIRVVLHNRRTFVYRDGKLVRSFRVVVGAHHTPTPRGHFYVVERVKLHTSWAHGLWALATSAHSNVLQEFDGGDGQVALHARGSLGAALGTAASHGCVRVANGTIAWMARVIPRGTPIDIVR
jgi:lipoprotein-anchoring transpeptidase ErfK/SrfK